jgi:GAF domain-containing protein
MPATLSQQEMARLADVTLSGVLTLNIADKGRVILRRLAQEVGIATCAVTIVGRYYQHFKAAVGVDLAFTPREYGFCTHTILQNGPLVVPDATRDRRFSDSHFVAGPPYIRFYAGVPLTMAHGHRLGAVCLLDVTPRNLSAAGLACLVAAGAAVEQLIRHAGHANEVDGLRRSIAEGMALDDRDRVLSLRDRLRHALSERAQARSPE